nr:immunoglobulin heavy chain junction region [Macaca mulatta]MOW25762.1 immunoglobulin heavy chain junction region [Macaca mulatta]MOW26010.1 immunoglobulin heavy chain junction region [Macaca mulatta]MOW26252.1 immunoglobulin heavy chain junction region [Macaca mulatta]
CARDRGSAWSFNWFDVW